MNFSIICFSDVLFAWVIIHHRHVILEKKQPQLPRNILSTPSLLIFSFHHFYFSLPSFISLSAPYLPPRICLNELINCWSSFIIPSSFEVSIIHSTLHSAGPYQRRALCIYIAYVLRLFYHMLHTNRKSAFLSTSVRKKVTIGACRLPRFLHKKTTLIKPTSCLRYHDTINKSYHKQCNQLPI